MERFLFNKNIFEEDEEYVAAYENEAEINIVDSGAGMDVDVEVEIPPVYTQGEIDAAKKQAFAEGEKKGLEDAKKSRSEHIKKIMGDIGAELVSLQARAQEQKASYEENAVRLSMAIFEQLFPVYVREKGLGELKEAIMHVMNTQVGHEVLDIYMHPDMIDSAVPFVSQLEKSASGIKIATHADEAITAYGCRIEWPGGGASFEPDILAEAVHDEMLQALAGTARNGHDDEKVDTARKADTPAEVADTVKVQASKEKEELITDTSTENSNIDENGDGT